MSPALPVRPFGTRAFLLELADQAAVHRAWARLTAARRAGSGLMAGVEEVVAGARTVLVVTGPGAPDPVSLSGRMSEWLSSATGADRADPGVAPGRDVEIPVVYDGPDLDEVAGLTGLSAAEVVSRHAGAVWTAGFLGFAPGFAYLGGGDPALAVPRRDEPRPAVAAGAVGLAGGMSAVYPSEMPGGWRLIGRTDRTLFDPASDPPALLAPGDRVRFRPVDHLPGASALPVPDRGASGSAAAAGRVAGPVAEVVRPGPRTTVQDRGRIGHAHEGVPRAGAVDRASFEEANSLVGNPLGAAALETTLSGPTLRFPAGGLVAAAGADAPVSVDGRAPSRFPARVPAGGVVGVGTARRGLRTYLAVAGGITVPAVLGSRSTDTLSGLGPAALRAGDVLPIGPADAGGPGRGSVPRAAGTRIPEPGEAVVVRAVPGPRADWLAPGELETLFRAEMSVTPVSDRVGLRTDGLGLDVRPGDLPSEGMVAGAVQVPPGGRPILLLANHATTGGYPVVAVVVEEDLALLAQLRPGARFRLAPPGTGADRLPPAR